ncbi:aldose epimerase family protein [Aestuariivivens sp. NBU2969]|uniref:aldose epimerase family protein n=1 Tax=Aestuariivivens sp. NBU2969 TaxID=2873267 RepID=UPI001CBB77EE|nr:aldose epimerase family protein [Aestuariivivens sp. NBU2969]
MNLECKIKKSKFGQSPAGDLIYCYELKHANGLIAKVINFGGILTELYVPDKFGKYANVVLGFQDVHSYLKENIYAGAIIGRVAGRLTKGKFNDGKKTYQLTQNEGETHLHGGIKGFDKSLWGSKIVTKNKSEVLELTYHSPNGEEGYPGNVSMKVTYSLTKENGIRIEYEATTDELTPLCPTNHSYFNLAGEGKGTILNHLLTIDSELIAEVDQNYLPTGNLKKTVADITDYKKAAPIERMAKIATYAHGEMYLLDNFTKDLKKVASLQEPKSGRTMNVFTDAIGMQLYTGLFLNTTSKGRSGAAYKPFSGVCFECQGFSDAPNHKTFASIFLHPDECFKQVTEYRFENNFDF